MISLLRGREREGLTYRELSGQTGISQASLYGWARRLREESKAAQGRQGFVELRVCERAAGAGAIEVFLASGRRLRVERGFDGETLGRLLGVLERGC